MNFLSIATGIFICFFSIVFRRILSAIIGFVLGAGFGGLIAFLIDMNSGLGTSGYVIIILILGILIAIISFKFYRFFVFLFTFIISFALFFVLALYVTDSDMNVSIPIAIILAIIAGIVGAILYDPLFIISTAFLGSTLLSSGGVSLFGGTDIIQLMENISWNGSGAELFRVTILTIVLSIAGIIVQFMLLKKINQGNSNDSYKKKLTANKKCRQCEKIYTGTGICPNCGSSFYEETNESLTSIAPVVAPAAQIVNSGDAWVCKKCGENNNLSSNTCKGCGEYK